MVYLFTQNDALVNEILMLKVHLLVLENKEKFHNPTWESYIKKCELIYDY